MRKVVQVRPWGDGLDLNHPQHMVSHFSDQLLNIQDSWCPYTLHILLIYNSVYYISLFIQFASVTFRYGYISLQLQLTTVTIRNGYNTFRYVTNPYFITSYITIANLHFSILSFALHRETQLLVQFDMHSFCVGVWICLNIL